MCIFIHTEGKLIFNFNFRFFFCVTVWLFSFGYHPHELVDVFYCYNFCFFLSQNVAIPMGYLKKVKKKKFIKKLWSTKVSLTISFFILKLIFYFLRSIPVPKTSFSYNLSSYQISFLFLFHHSVKFRVKIHFDQPVTFSFSRILTHINNPFESAERLVCWESNRLHYVDIEKIKYVLPFDHHKAKYQWLFKQKIMVKRTFLTHDLYIQINKVFIKHFCLYWK